jgi:hypothetical protein
MDASEDTLSRLPGLHPSTAMSAPSRPTPTGSVTVDPLAAEATEVESSRADPGRVDGGRPGVTDFVVVVVVVVTVVVVTVVVVAVEPLCFCSCCTMDVVVVCRLTPDPADPAGCRKKASPASPSCMDSDVAWPFTKMRTTLSFDRSSLSLPMRTWKGVQRMVPSSCFTAMTTTRDHRRPG